MPHHLRPDPNPSTHPNPGVHQDGVMVSIYRFKGPLDGTHHTASRFKIQDSRFKGPLDGTHHTHRGDDVDGDREVKRDHFHRIEFHGGTVGGIHPADASI